MNTETVTCSTLTEFISQADRFARQCRPAGRGRPTKTGARLFIVCGIEVTVTHGETCLGGSWGMSTRYMVNGMKASKKAVLKAISEA